MRILGSSMYWKKTDTFSTLYSFITVCVICYMLSWHLKMFSLQRQFLLCKKNPSYPSTMTTCLINFIMLFFFFPQKVTKVVHISRWSCPTASSLTGLTYPSPYVPKLKCWMSILRKMLENSTLCLNFVLGFFFFVQPIS